MQQLVETSKRMQKTSHALLTGQSSEHCLLRGLRAGIAYACTLSILPRCCQSGICHLAIGACCSDESKTVHQAVHASSVAE